MLVVLKLLLEASSQSFSSSSLYSVHLPTNLLPLCPAVAHYIGRQQQQQQGNLILHQVNDCCTPKTRGLCRPAASAHMRRLCVMQPGSITHDICNLDPSLTLSATWIQNSSSSCLVSTVRCDQSKQHFKSLSSNLAFILEIHKRFIINKQQTQYSLKVSTVCCGQSLQHFKSLRSNLAFILEIHKRFFINKRNFHKRSIH